MRKNFIFKMSVVFVMGIMALGQVSCSSKTETNVDKEGEASSESQGDVFFQTRGIILSWDDVKKPEVLDWLKLSENAGITTLSVFGADIYSLIKAANDKDIIKRPSYLLCLLRQSS
jgi:hypothetical protein